MPSISTIDAQGLYTKKLVEVYKQKISPTGFLRSFFRREESATLEVSIEVQRGYEKVAVDVIRGTEGNRNQFTRTTEKIFIPPLYKEYFDRTTLQLYDRLYGATEINDAIFAQYINNVADAIVALRDKIERAYELQCAQVFETGVVKLNAPGTSIDFKRKTGSIVDLGAGNYFANNVDPFVVFQNGCNFLRQTGKAVGGKFIAIMGSTALSDLLANTKFTARQNLFNMALDTVNSPLMNAEGATYHGTVTAGSYKVELWAYPQFYDDPTTGVQTAYVNPKKITIIPENLKAILGFAAVPQLITPNNPIPQQGQYLIRDFIDERLTSHVTEIASAGIAIPVAVDQIYTVQVVA